MRCGKSRAGGIVKKIKTNKVDFYKTLLYVVKLVFKETNGRATVAALYYIVDNLFPTVFTLFSARIFSLCECYLIETRQMDQSVFGILSLLAVAFLMKVILEYCGSLCINSDVYEKCTARLRIMTAQKKAGLSLISDEDPEILNMVQRSKECVDQERISSVFMITVVIITTIFGFVSIIGVLTRYHWLFLPISIISAIPELIVYIQVGKRKIDLNISRTDDRRKRDNYWSYLVSERSVRELRLSNATDFVHKKWDKINKKIEYEILQEESRENKLLLLGNIIRVSGSGIGIALAFLLTQNGEMSVSVFGACIIAFISMQGVVHKIFQEFGSLKENIGYAGHFHEFMKLTEEEIDQNNKLSFNSKIELKGVGFRYPGQQYQALSNINFTLKKGEHIAVVGYNGSGKTTLIKVLSGLYLPNEDGNIYIDGDEVIEGNRGGLYRHISLVSQDFGRYSLTLRENVGISEISELNNTGRIEECLLAADCPHMPVDELIGKEFGGIEPSGGQWQKIAIARALFRKADLYFLDEPTASLDPRTETEILLSFLRMMEGKTSVIISHRIGLCRFVDRIVVMHNGRIAEEGSFDDLIARRGMFFEMYQEQSKWYVN